MEQDKFHKAEHKFLDAMNWIDKNNDFSEAQKVLLSLVEQYPDFPNPYAIVGFIYSNKLSNPKLADYYYKKGLEVDSQYLPTYYNYASFLQYELRHDELEKHLEKMLVFPTISMGDVFFQYGVMREYQKRYKESINYFKRAIKETTNPDLLAASSQGIARARLKRVPFLWKAGPNNTAVLNPLSLLLIVTVLILAIAFISPLLNWVY